MQTQSGTQEPLMTIKATGTWEFGFKSAVKLDNLEAAEENDAVREAAPAEVDMAVAALLGCTCSIVPTVAREMGFRHSGMDFTGEAQFSIENLTPSGATRRFEAIHGTVHVRTDESPERLADLAAEVKRRCGVLRILEKAGISPDIEWKIAKPGG